MKNRAKNTPDKETLRKFAITISVALGAIGAFFLWRKGQAGLIFIAIGAIILLAGLAWPKSLSLLFKAWMAFSLILGLIMNHIILSLVYYLVLSPIGLLMKALGKNPLTLKLDREANSYWKKRKMKEWKKENYEKMF